ncbi:hypothetical protein CE91St30_31020 [Raoultibacter timonensis]|uniref:Uncharacterized protein n=1 Tax=Raoultibacter timonensis TaxID=1907662 RepID=A0ABN6MKI3_9ACTN|nr:hypothetical protein CE91St30_31020 [Raoultibacter timonensis]BDF52372.1 hypothetical protein CE91St31_31020 [Raoultibacter timonensis]
MELWLNMRHQSKPEAAKLMPSKTQVKIATNPSVAPKQSTTASARNGTTPTATAGIRTEAWCITSQSACAYPSTNTPNIAKMAAMRRVTANDSPYPKARGSAMLKPQYV